MLGGIWEGADGMIVVDVVVEMSAVGTSDFAQFHQKSQFAVGFPLDEDWAGVFGKG